jgi:flagellin
MRIQHNIPAMSSYRNYTSNTYEFVKTGEKPKSGNTAIEISDFNKMPDAKAIGDAFSNVAKGATVEVADDGTVTITANEVDGSIPKLNVSFYEGKGGLKLQIGDTSEEYNQLKVSVGDMHTVAMGIDGIDISNQDGAAAAIDVIKNAINYVSGVRGDFGAIQNRLDHTANNLSVMAENIQDAESTIRDTDVAEEMMSYVKNNILVQSAQAMLAQANQVPQGVLQLLG